MNSSKRKIAIVTGTRAEYGHLYWIIHEVWNDPDLVLQLIVCGMHLSPEFGLTVREIEADGFPIAEKVEMLLSSDSEVGVSISIGLGIIGFAKAFDRLKPDILVLLGDRFEILAAASAAMVARIPIAHIHGGESTEGAIDEAIRHAVTKMSHIHFPATECYGRRIAQMGEDPERIFPYGAPGLDHIAKGNLPPRREILGELGIPPTERVALVTYHPVTLEPSTARRHMENLWEALQGFDLRFVFTYANADPGGREINRMIEDFISRSSKFLAAPSLGQRRYLGMMKNAEVVIGNSSSGIIEASALRIPAVNIGDRQRGRVRGANVIDCGIESDEIRRALDWALNPGFRKSLENMASPYGQGEVSRKIVDTLKRIPLSEELLKKRFWDQ
jgi:UDP-hydrolysing UDP-N-acetyl-D-glucosamine 2-epimerase